MGTIHVNYSNNICIVSWRAAWLAAWTQYCYPNTTFQIGPQERWLSINNATIPQICIWFPASWTQLVVRSWNKSSCLNKQQSWQSVLWYLPMNPTIPYKLERVDLLWGREGRKWKITWSKKSISNQRSKVMLPAILREILGWPSYLSQDFWYFVCNTITWKKK